MDRVSEAWGAKGLPEEPDASSVTISSSVFDIPDKPDETVISGAKVVYDVSEETGMSGIPEDLFGSAETDEADDFDEMDDIDESDDSDDSDYSGESDDTGESEPSKVSLFIDRLRSSKIALVIIPLVALLLAFQLAYSCGSNAGRKSDDRLSGVNVASVPQTPLPDTKPVPVFKKGHREVVIPEKLIPEKEADLPSGVLVMIDNYSPARPQSGLDKADVVYEIIAEGGITRYMALFYSEAAPLIGPVRSARYYFVQLAKGMDLPYAHVGGAEDALAMIGSLRIKDLNEMSNAAKYFWQDPKRNRPHSTYTSTEKLIEAIANKQYAYKKPDLPPVAEEFTGSSLADGQVSFTYSPGKNGYRATWIWDESLGDGGRYQRYINDKIQLCADGAPMVADTIFVLVAPSKPRNTDPVSSEVAIVGSGEALRIVDNKITKGAWKKESAERPLFITDTADWPMTMKDGKTWIQVVDSLEAVSFGKQ